MSRRDSNADGFTLVELLLVMAIIALLLTIAAPRYFDSLDRAKESTLRTDLRIMREAIDKHMADTGRFPETLQELADARYLRSIPVDPMTDSADTWVLQAAGADTGQTRVADVHSGASGEGRDGTPYASW
jgi:general secretion pathway protein G